jgi:hypothetical protein
MDNYKQFGGLEWDNKLRTLIGDVIRNRRRKDCQAERRENPDLSAPKRGRPRKACPVTDEREKSSSPISGDDFDE